MNREGGGWLGVPQRCVRFVQNVRTSTKDHGGPGLDIRGWSAAAATLLAAGLGFGPGPALAQVCSYPQLTDDVPQVFAATPAFTRFNQANGRWAAVAVKSGGSANWDIGLSTGTAPFAACLTAPVVTSQQSSGVDFVLGDFAAEGTGTYYAPIGRAAGTGSATIEWDSGARSLVLGPNPQAGQSPPGLIDCWNVDLEAGTSYSFILFGDNVDDYRLYAFRRGLANSWRQKSDALVEVISNLSSPPALTAPATDRYALVVVNMTGSASPYELTMTACVNPPDLAVHVSLPVPLAAPNGVVPYELDVASAGFPTVAVRSWAANYNWDLGIHQRDGIGFPPCDGTYRAGSGDYGPRVDLLVGDLASGLITPSTTHWVTAIRGGIHPQEGRIEYSPGLDAIAIDGPTQYVTGGNDLVVRTFRAELLAGVPVTIHVAKCGPATGKLRVFRPFDTSDPSNSGWSSPSGSHAPLATVDITHAAGVGDFVFTPPVAGSYALVLTNESGENCCFELGISTCAPRAELMDGTPRTIWAPIVGPSYGEPHATRHGRFGWSAVAVLPNAVVEDWIIEAWDAPAGGAPAPQLGCLSGPLGATTEDGTGSRVDFLARYDGWIPPFEEWLATLRAYPAALTSPGGGAQVEYEQHNTTLEVGTLVNGFPLSPLDFLEVWNIDLVGGQPYAIHFQPVGFTGELFVMKSLLAGSQACAPLACMPEYLALGGPGQVLRTAEPTVFTPAESGSYGLIVIHQIGGFGTFSLAVNPTTVGAGTPPAPRVTGFRSAAPNPLRTGSTQLAFDLAHEASVGFDIVNIAGRVVARVAERAYPAGSGQAAWSGRDGDGRAITPGLYFVRMRVDGAITGDGGKLIVM